MKSYTLFSVLHSGKIVAREIADYATIQMEVARQKSLNAFYREAWYTTKTGKLKEIRYGHA